MPPVALSSCGACRDDFNVSAVLAVDASRANLVLASASAAAATMRAAAGCSVVLYTVHFGGYDSFATFQARHARFRTDRACYIALVDTLAFNASYWTPVLLPELPFPTSAARSAHVLKSIPYELFPHSNWVVYMDSKTILRSDVSRWVVALSRSHPDKEGDLRPAPSADGPARRRLVARVHRRAELGVAAEAGRLRGGRGRY